ncbi:MAG: TetR/AcrR family transcriptional regulator [Bacilli bacterium]|nr:TetR/AcrR family transcriptional regulator [Bacilli bacterium]
MNREQKKQLTEERILKVAIQLFTEQGYESTTVAKITEQAGVAKGTFFNYFHCKEDLLCKIQVNSVFEEAKRVMHIQGPMIPLMKAYIQELATRIKLNRSLARAIEQGNLSSPQLFANQIKQLNQINEALTPLFAKGQNRGEIEMNLEPGQLAQMAVQTYYGVMMSYCYNQGDDNLAIQMALSFDLFFKGISKGHI